MECFCGCISVNSNLIVNPFRSPEFIEGQNLKNWLMISRTTLNKIIIISFMVLIGFSLAKAIYHGSFMGITLALVSLGAAIYFLYVLAKAKEDMEMEAEEAA